LRDHGAGALVPPTHVTLADWVDQWLDLTAPNLRPTTQATYRAALAPIVAHVGHVKLDKLTPLSLAGTFVKLAHNGKGSRAIQQSYTYLHGCLGRAVALGVLGVNPLDRVPRPHHAARERRFWTADEARRFLAAVQDTPHRYAPLFAFLLGTGCHLGEALAVEWGDLDSEQNTVRINKAVSYVGGQPITQQPKTRAGVRVLTLPTFVLHVLRSLPRAIHDGPIFRTAVGTVPLRRNLLRAFRVLIGQADVSLIPIHGLRHGHAALVLAQGSDVQALRRRLGHARASVTLDLYAYALS
jgi:integrase